MASVVEPNPHMIWVPVAANTTNTVVVGSIVTCGTDGVLAMGAASGAFDTTGKNGALDSCSIPLGIVVGTSRQNELYNTTYKRNSIVSAITSNANFTVDMAGIEGGWGQDKQAYVQVALIGPETIIRIPIYDSSLGTAPTVKAATSVTANGMGYVTATFGFTSVQYNTSSYCRSGSNMGIYRVTTNAANATTFTFSSPWPADLVAGDTFVHVNCRTFGLSRIQLDDTSSWVDSDAALTADYYGAIVTKLNLATAGEEYVDCMLNAFTFLPALA